MSHPLSTGQGLEVEKLSRIYSGGGRRIMSRTGELMGDDKWKLVRKAGYMTER